MKQYIKKLMLPASTLLGAIAWMVPVHAQLNTDTIKNVTPTGSSSDASNVNTTIKNVINILLFAVGVGAVIMLIIGAIRYVVSAGDQQAVAGAKNTIIYAIVGIVVAVMAFAIVSFVVGPTGLGAPTE